MSFNWPGNIRQLEQAIYAAVAICEGNQIRPGDFPGWLQNALKSERQVPINHLQGQFAIDESLTTVEDDAYLNVEYTKYLNALDSTKYPGTGRWNLSAASRILNIPRKTFTYRLKKLDLLK